MLEKDKAIVSIDQAAGVFHRLSELTNNLIRLYVFDPNYDFFSNNILAIDRYFAAIPLKGTHGQ
jgi:hypothetical protein